MKIHPLMALLASLLAAVMAPAGAQFTGSVGTDSTAPILKETKGFACAATHEWKLVGGRAKCVPKAVDCDAVASATWPNAAYQDPATCRAALPKTADKASHWAVSVINDGVATWHCNAGTWELKNHSCHARRVSYDCTAQTVGWSNRIDGTRCSGPAPATPNGSTTSVNNTAAGAFGSAILQCNGGSFSALSSTCERGGGAPPPPGGPAACAASPVSWMTHCSASAPAGTEGQTFNASYGSVGSAYTGTAQFLCTGGAWAYQTGQCRPNPPDCPKGQRPDINGVCRSPLDVRGYLPDLGYRTYVQYSAGEYYFAPGGDHTWALAGTNASNEAVTVWAMGRNHWYTTTIRVNGSVAASARAQDVAQTTIPVGASWSVLVTSPAESGMGPYLGFVSGSGPGVATSGQLGLNAGLSASDGPAPSITVEVATWNSRLPNGTAAPVCRETGNSPAGGFCRNGAGLPVVSGDLRGYVYSYCPTFVGYEGNNPDSGAPIFDVALGTRIAGRATVTINGRNAYSVPAVLESVNPDYEPCRNSQGGGGN